LDDCRKTTAYLLVISGVVIITVAEILKGRGLYFFRIFFTPIVWTGYVLLLDGFNYLRRGESLIITDTVNFLFMIPISIGLWYLFEFYNLFLNNWHYINLPENRAIRYFGYFWSFATIWPAILETYSLFKGFGLFSKVKVKPYKLTSKTFWILVIIGAIFEILPFVFPNRYWAPTIWTGFILLLDPINYRLKLPSLFGRWETGEMGALWRLFLSGLTCGFFWEFWNFWAGAKWKYTIPYFGDIKLFEMPIVGFLGFLPFAVEVFTLYIFVGWLFKKFLGIEGITYRL